MIGPLLFKDIMAFVNAYKGNGGCFNNSNARLAFAQVNRRWAKSSAVPLRGHRAPQSLRRLRR
jgi:hypothetical protein